MVSTAWKRIYTKFQLLVVCLTSLILWMQTTVTNSRSIIQGTVQQAVQMQGAWSSVTFWGLNCGTCSVQHYCWLTWGSGIFIFGLPHMKVLHASQYQGSVTLKQPVNIHTFALNTITSLLKWNLDWTLIQHFSKQFPMTHSNITLLLPALNTQHDSTKQSGAAILTNWGLRFLQHWCANWSPASWNCVDTWPDTNVGEFSLP
jgi:hypothetical protein